MSSEYDMVARGKLKLKTDLTNGGSIKKKKKKSKSKDISNHTKTEDMRLYSRSSSNDDPSTTHGQSTTVTPVGKTMTKAEVAFKKMQEKMQEKRIMEKASMTHKQRVEKFNEHLDGLTEHFDIPKVSWTK